MTNTLEKVLQVGGKEILPREDLMFSILNQIPEKKNTFVSTRNIRSPYVRIVFTQLVSLCLLFVVVYPTHISSPLAPSAIDEEYSLIDTQAEEFELYMDQTDYDEPLVLY
jgi:hypothetical protein